jgi:hypothetical protein
VIGVAERAALQRLGENLPRIWQVPTTSAADRKRILRFVIREVVLDQKRAQGQVWLKIIWQTGAASEHSLQRRVHTYRDDIDVERLRQRITGLNGAGKMDKEIAAILNQEGFVAARGCTFKGENVWLLRTRWGIPTVKINGVGANPTRWPDGSFSIQRIKSIDFALACDARGAQKRRHHEAIGSPNTLGHSPNARLVVTTMDLRS